MDNVERRALQRFRENWLGPDDPVSDDELYRTVKDTAWFASTCVSIAAGDFRDAVVRSFPRLERARRTG